MRTQRSTPQHLTFGEPLQLLAFFAGEARHETGPARRRRDDGIKGSSDHS